MSDIQINFKEYFNSDYISKYRFNIYSEQLESILSIEKISSIAEIGIGNGILSYILKKMNFEVTTIDYDPMLEPDVVCNILELKKNIKRKFDLVICFEVLEHIDFKYFKTALENLKYISNNYILFSVPYAGITFKIELQLSKYGIKSLMLKKRIPLFWEKHEFDGQHYWEVGKKNYSRKKIRNEINEVMKIEKEWLLSLNESQIFYLCKNEK